MRNKEKVQRRVRVVLAAAGFGGVGSAGVVVLGPMGLMMGAALLLLGYLLFAAVLFSRRNEPSERLERLIKLFRRR